MLLGPRPVLSPSIPGLRRIVSHVTCHSNAKWVAGKRELVLTQPSFLVARSVFALPLTCSPSWQPRAGDSVIAQHLAAKVCAALDTPNLLGYAMNRWQEPNTGLKLWVNSTPRATRRFPTVTHPSRGLRSPLGWDGTKMSRCPLPSECPGASLGLRCKEGARHDVTKSPECGQCQGRCGRNTMDGGPIEVSGPRAWLLRDP